MTKDQKINAIMNNIALNYNDFQQQAKDKLKKQRKITFSSSDHRELVCDVVYSVINKLNTIENVNRFYNMCKTNKLKLYIFKAIDINTKFVSSPFIQNKLKIFNKGVIIENNNYFDDVSSEETHEYEEIKEAEKDFLFFYIMSLVELPKAKELLGEDWKYYSTLFKEYFCNVNATYLSLENKYGFPSSTLYRDVTYVKNKIKEDLEKNNIYYKLK